MTLAEFLLERIADDEAVAHGSEPMRLGVWGNHLIRDRVLADCEAKRRIVELHAHHARWDDANIGDQARATLELLALPYADHPDCREEWKP